MDTSYRCSLGRLVYSGNFDLNYQEIDLNLKIVNNY